jgi:5-methylcytosine-specific restriction endonuclease McrA
MRDGNQCTVIETGRRCEEKSHLEVAHIIPLRKLWTVTHGAAFVRAATALSNLTTACPHHNRLLDEEARKEKVA